MILTLTQCKGLWQQFYTTPWNDDYIKRQPQISRLIKRMCKHYKIPSPMLVAVTKLDGDLSRYPIKELLFGGVYDVAIPQQLEVILQLSL